MTTETLIVAAEFTPLDLLLWRRFRSEAARRVEATIALNPGICGHVFLPVGTEVLVEIPSPAAAPWRELVPLWG